MRKDQVYQCFLTIRLVEKSHDGQRTLDTQLVHIPITGSEGSEYHIDYHICLPKYFHLSRKSLSVISGQIEVSHGHGFLSNDRQTFIYEMDAGVLVVRYINQNYQEVGHGMVSRDMETNLLDVTHQVPVPRGYHCDYIAGYRINKLAQSLVIRVKGNTATLQQSALEVIKKEIDHSGRSLRQQVHTIHISGRIGDSFSLHPADYQFPDTLPTEGTSDVNGIITPNGVDPVQVKFVYVKMHRDLLTYPLTVKILKKNQKQLDSHTVVKSVQGKLHQHYHYSYHDFQPKDYQLDARSLKSVDGVITKQGLSHPAVAFIYDQIKMLDVKYVNQSHRVVGRSRVHVTGQVLNHIQHYLELPSGYILRSYRPFKQTAGTLVISVCGKKANSAQSAVKLQIVRRQSNGHLINRQSRIIHIAGDVGDRFSIDPASQCPIGFLNWQNHPVNGWITFGGTYVDHHTLTYVKKPSAKRILVRYLNYNNQLVLQKSFSGAIGKPFNQKLIRKAVPEHYRPVKVVSGDQIRRFSDRDQVITVQVERITAQQPVRSTSASDQSASASEAVKSASAVSAAQENPSSSVQSRGSSASERMDSQSSSAPSQSSAAQSTSTDSAQSAESDQASGSSAANSAAQSADSQSLHHVNVVKKAFMYRCYNQIFSTNLMDWSRHCDQRKVQAGIKLADDYIRGISDALNQKKQAQHTSKSYHYGYRICLKYAKREPHPTVVKILMAIMEASSLMKI